MHGVSDEGGLDCEDCQQIAKDLGLPGPDFSVYLFNNDYHVERLRRRLAQESLQLVDEGCSADADQDGHGADTR